MPNKSDWSFVISTDIDGAQNFDAKVRFAAHRVNGSESGESPRVRGSIPPQL
ncbi:hypothetical protein J2X67_005485 [Variovorax sp. 3319]|nr:hypothetical protein [Variovorax sp. 3319]